MSSPKSSSGGGGTAEEAGLPLECPVSFLASSFMRHTLATSGQRVGTLILYLADVEEGGATYLPTLDMAVHPRRGMALWFDYCDNGKTDPRSLHGGTPIIRGEKWIATKWFRERPFRG